MTETKRRKVTASLNPDQFADLEALMKEDGQTNLTFFVVYLINQEKKRRSEVITKKPVGRPKKEDEVIVYYPSPDLKFGNRNPYTKEAYQAYCIAHKQPMPDPMPEPLTKEELAKWDL